MNLGDSVFVIMALSCAGLFAALVERERPGMGIALLYVVALAFPAVAILSEIIP